jgi:uncharacterized protein (TIGR00661 family)
MAYEDNEVRRWQTVVQNLRGAVSGWPETIREHYKLCEEFSPDVVIGDFESFATLFAKRHRLPLLCVDNIQVLDRCRHEPTLLAGRDGELAFARRIVAMKAPGAFHYVATSFFFPSVRKPRTTLVPSILRPEILAARSEPGEHLLVYQTATGNDVLPRALSAAGVPCLVYGLRRDLEEDVVDGRLVYRPFSEERFAQDLRTARAVVAGGGFTLLSEAVYLRKPVLSIPIRGQFEQVLNALYLEHLGYGMHADEPTADAVSAFLERIPRCLAALEGYEQDGNEVALSVIHARLAEAGERTPRARRR